MAGCFRLSSLAMVKVDMPFLASNKVENLNALMVSMSLAPLLIRFSAL
jgi:molybdopterin-guanine dinucleotide biosynthesis protein A